MTRRSDNVRTALFPGSFNPFTVGHKSIVERALLICDRLIIAIGVNPEKGNADVERRIAEIQRIFRDDERVEVAAYTGLTVEFARRAGASFMVRGVRNAQDFDYERNLADINRDISGMETIFIPTLPEMGFISSSMVRELDSNGIDTGKYLP